MRPIGFKGYLYGLGLIWVVMSESVLYLTDALCFGATRKVGDKHVARLWRRMLAITHTTLRVHHVERLDPQRSYVYMSNHESILDIAVSLGGAPQSIRMVAKKELFRIPLFGRAMLGAGFIPIDRKNLEKAKQQLELAKERLKAGMSFWIYPEGTRSRGLQLLPFKKGGFHVALALGIPIVPVWIEGAGKVLPSDTLHVTPYLTIGVHFGHPIETIGKTLGDLMTEVFEAIENTQ